MPKVNVTVRIKLSNLPWAFHLVEMEGVEPSSESISTGVSPSAAFVLKFRIHERPKAGYHFSYPVVPIRYRELPHGFPVWSMPCS